MMNRIHTTEEIIAMLHQMDVLVSQGKSVANIVNDIDVANITFLHEEKAFNGPTLHHSTKLRNLEIENNLLRRAVSDLTVDKYNLMDKDTTIYQDPLTSNTRMAL